MNATNVPHWYLHMTTKENQDNYRKVLKKYPISRSLSERIISIAETTTNEPSDFWATLNLLHFLVFDAQEEVRNKLKK